MRVGDGRRRGISKGNIQMLWSSGISVEAGVAGIKNLVVTGQRVVARRGVMGRRVAMGSCWGMLGSGSD